MTKSAGLSLIEMLAAMAILMLLSSLSIASIQAVREASRKSLCLNQMRQVCLGLQQFEAANGRLPPTINFSRHNSNLHWQAMALPFVDEANLFNDITSDGVRLRSTSIYMHPHQLTAVSMFQCPSDLDHSSLVTDKFANSFAFTDYCGIAGVDLEHPSTGIFPVAISRLASRVRLEDIFDGLSNTFCFGERPPNPTDRGYGRWLGSQQTSLASIGVYERYENFNATGSFTSCLDGPVGFRPGERGQPSSALHHWSYHPGGANFARIDGSVQMIRYSVDPKVLRALSTRDGFEPLPE